MDFSEMVKRQKRLNNIFYYTMIFYRQIWSTKAHYSSPIFWLMFIADNLVPNFISAPILVEAAVLYKHGLIRKFIFKIGFTQLTF